jgi:mono/diheme cytochrome c family protein
VSKRLALAFGGAAISLVIAGSMVAAQSPAARTAAHADAVTYTKHVAPILFRNCTECHRPAMSAPMSLMSYDEVRPWARAIKQRVLKREMPPWSADPAYGKFKNDPSLSQQEIDTIAAWVDAGAPRGEEKDLPAAPQYTDGWTIGTPDAVFTMTEPFHVPADGTIPYQYIRVPTNLTEDKWIQAIEFKPGDRRVVHHIIASAQPAGGNARDERTPGRVGLGGITPNKPGVTFAPGVARLLPANSDIILQMHYTTVGEPTSDVTRVAVKWAKNPPERMVGGGNVLNVRFAIPPGAANHEVRAERTFAEDTLLTSMMPHMHVRGKSMKYIAHYPDGRSETLLYVPKYDFNWQHSYELEEPKLLPKGTRLEVIAIYDNSSGNPFNPDPTATVRWGDQTWEEMMIGFYSTIVPARRGTTTSQQ